MPFAFCYPLNRVWSFSYVETIRDIAARVAQDLRVDPEQISFLGDSGVLLVPEDGMRVTVKCKECGSHN